jgi:glycosyltransferase involved in cell wall biosynthesis
MPICAVLSFRLGGTDGVSIVADTWIGSLHRLGFEVITVAGEGPVDVTIPDLAIGRWPDGAAGRGGESGADDDTIDELAATVDRALADVDLVIVENLGTIPMNLPASLAVAEARAGQPTIWHHHDPAWQRDRYRGVEILPIPESVESGGTPMWRHVTINDLTRDQLRDRGIVATTIRNAFDVDAPLGDRDAERARHGFAPDELVLVHPVRAIERKDVPRALAIAESVGATYWLTGPAEEGYGPTLESLLADAGARGVKVVHEPAESLVDLHAAADGVLFPSTWEGFGNPPVEAAIAGRPAIVGHYPAAEELRGLGFEWLDPDDVEGIRAALRSPDPSMLERNRVLASEHLSLRRLDIALGALLDAAGWSA